MTTVPPTTPPVLPEPLGIRSRHTSRIWTIFTKEFREIFRDRRTVISVVISPLVITPLLLMGVGLMVGSQAEKEKARVYHIGVIGGIGAPALSAELERNPQLECEDVTTREAEARIGKRKLNAAISFPSNTQSLLSAHKPVPISILLDAGEETSQAAANRVSAAMNQIGEKVIGHRFQQLHLESDFATPFQISETPIKTGGSIASLMLATMLPYLLVVSSFGGGIYAAFDQVAGEKERGTLETLLVSPASRRDIVLGKFVAIMSVCLISSILSVTGMFIAFSLPASMLAAIAKGGLHLSPPAIVVSLLMMVPIAVLFAGVLLAVSTFARNQKEAQTYLTPLLLLVIMPAMMSIFLGSDVSRALALVPVLGTSLIIKQAFSGSYDPVFIVLAFAASAAYAGAALLFAIRLFQKESVLIKA